jgi:hypothetical protein
MTLLLRLLASNNKDQPPLSDHLKNYLILVDSIKMIPLGLCNMYPWAHSKALIFPTINLFPY